jgi:hypothetical protein
MAPRPKAFVTQRAGEVDGIRSRVELGFLGTLEVCLRLAGQ